MHKHTALLILALASAPALATDVTMYKSPTCGCCKEWAVHLKANGFNVVSKDVANIMPYKGMNGVPAELGSCHTALVEGYTIEGHVPAADIRRLLKERPPVRGLAVPGMPASAPGMDSGTGERYQTISFDRDGRTAIYAQH